MFEQRDHIHTGLYRFEWEHRRDVDGVPAELTLDHRFAGMVSVFIEPADGVTGEQVGAWLRERYLSATLPGSAVATALGFSPLPLLADAPGDVPRGETLDERVLVLCFVDEAPDGSWDRVFAPLGAALDDAGLGTVIWSSAFIGTVPGTDTYTDRLWADQ
jgi:hypothetical protein